MSYKLLAADMDSTALTKDKRLTERTVNAMAKAIEQGKHVLFSTGRSICFVKPYIDMVPGMRYAICASGGSVIDTKTGEHILYKTIDEETVKMIIAAASGGYVMPILFRQDESYGTRWCVDCCEEFGVKYYEPTYRKYMNICEDAFNTYMENPGELEKINLFYAHENDAYETYEKIKTLPVSFSTKTAYSLEINAPGVSKAEGLKALCKHLGIELSECIAVGDAQNDEEMISVAGLKVAMGNAQDRIKRIADVVTSDCEHDGVAEIIEQYLLD